MKSIKKVIISILLISLILILFNNEIITFFSKLYKSFNRTLIIEKRYILFCKGLNSTLLISFSSIFFGSLIGILLFLCQKKNNILIKNISYFFIRFIQGTPITVLLLVFYFGIFGKININPIVVSILAFSIYFSAYVAEILKGAYSSINRIQIDSAYALGFTKMQTIRYIIIPQILCYIIPVYKNESVSLIKSTSIAGYISIVDLTKASDIIRNRTYEPFFPLVFTAFIYFTICYLFSKTLDFIYKKINPRMEKKYGK